MEKCKEGKVVTNHVFPISSVRILYLGRAVTALHAWHVRNKMLTAIFPRAGWIRIALWRVRSRLRRHFQCTNLGGVVLHTCYILPRHATLQDCFTAIATWQHRRNILLQTSQEYSTVTARPRYKIIRTLEIGSTWFATTFPSLHFSIFFQMAEYSYGPGLTGTLCI
jgi:hypothetical protein